MPNEAPKFPCPHCDFKSKNKAGLTLHLLKKHPNAADPLQCKKCDYKAKTVGGLNLHVQGKHRIKSDEVNCPDCSQVFPSVNLMSRHRRFAHGVLGREAAKRAAKEQQAQSGEVPEPAKTGRPIGSKTKSEGITVYAQATPTENNHDGHSLDSLAFALAIGSVKEFCRHTAEEHGIPTRQFIFQFAQLFLREARR